MIAAKMTRRLLVVGAAALTLSACGGLGNIIGPTDTGMIYVLQPVFAPAPAGATKVNWSLELMHPDVPGGLNSERIALIQPAGNLDYYASAAYPDRLPAAIQRAVLDGFEASGRIEGVAREEDALHADYNLLVEIKNFEAHYAVADGIPTVNVTIMAKLTTGRGRKVVASKLFTQTGTASVNSTAAVVQALSQALGVAVTGIVDWTLTAAPPVEAPAGSPNKPAEELLHETARGTAPKPPR
jgi:cholesterol transport system auxiliary component